jgi:hypothetical protein
MLPDPAFYAECLQESFDELKKAALGKQRVSQKATKRAKVG